MKPLTTDEKAPAFGGRIFKVGVVGVVCWWSLFFALACSADWCDRHGINGKFCKPIFLLLGFPAFELEIRLAILLHAGKNPLFTHIGPLLAWSVNGAFWAIVLDNVLGRLMKWKSRN